MQKRSFPPAPALGLAHTAGAIMSKRSRGSPGPAPEPEASSAKLVARLSRENLERLVVQSLDSVTPVSRSAVLSCLPEPLQSATVRVTIVSGGTSRAGTGLFDEIDDDILVPMIFMRLPSSDRFKCVISVCKAWHQLRERTELWRELDIHHAFKPKDFWPGMTGDNLLRLVSWLRNPWCKMLRDGPNMLPAVTTLALDSGGRKSDTNSIPPDAIEKALSEMSSITSLSLSGAKISAALLTHLATKKIPIAANLTSLNVTAPSAARSGLLSLLKRTGRLKHLTLAHDLACGGSAFAVLSDTLRAERGGGVPLLTKLITTGYSCGSERLGWSTVVHLGEIFPELEECRLQQVCDNSYRGQGRTAQTITNCLRSGRTFQLSPLPRLKSLSIGQLAGFTSGHMDTSELEAMFVAISKACPALQLLYIRHEKIWKRSNNNPVEMEPLPTATARCFNQPPPTITSLTLFDMILTSDAFSTAALPELKELKLVRCGPDAAAAASLLVDSCPRLSKNGVHVS
jgi:hypothetical protein